MFKQSTVISAICLATLFMAPASNALGQGSFLYKTAQDAVALLKTSPTPTPTSQSDLLKVTGHDEFKDLLPKLYRSYFKQELSVANKMEFVGEFFSYLQTAARADQEPPELVLSKNLYTSIRVSKRRLENLHGLTEQEIFDLTVDMAPKLTLQTLQKIFESDAPGLQLKMSFLKSYQDAQYRYLRSNSDFTKREYSEQVLRFTKYDHGRPFKPLAYYQHQSFENTVLVSAPKTRDDFEAIFERSASTARWQSVQKDLERLSSIIAGQEQESGRDPILGSVDELVRQIEEAKTPFVTIVGHNETGRLRFANGSTASLTDLANICEEQNKRCIFLSCESSSYLTNSKYSSGQYAINSTITYGDAAQFIEAIDKHRVKGFNSNLLRDTTPPSASLQSLEDTLPFILWETEKNILIKRKLRGVAVPGAAISGSGYLLYIAIDIDTVPEEGG